MLCDTKSQLKAEFRKKLNKYLSSKTSNDEAGKKENILQKFSEKRLTELICENESRVESKSAMKNQEGDIIKPVALRPKKATLGQNSYRLSTCLISDPTIGKRDSMFIDQRSSLRERRGVKSKSICMEKSEPQGHRERPCLNLMKNFVKQSDDDIFIKINQLTETNNFNSNCKNYFDEKFVQNFKIDLNQIENDSN